MIEWAGKSIEFGKAFGLVSVGAASEMCVDLGFAARVVPPICSILRVFRHRICSRNRPPLQEPLSFLIPRGK